MTGVSRSYICDIETGRMSPSMKTLMRITDSLSLSFFLQRRDGNTIQ
nr:MAG TPA: helix-turn-helix domain protein [Caudoviricetes sp.]